ncbi:MAG: helix-turn-helix domain-containing protein [Pseudomonadota bacterium]
MTDEADRIATDAVQNNNYTKTPGKSFSGAMIAATLPIALSSGITIEKIGETLELSVQDFFAPTARLPDDILPRLWLMIHEARPSDPTPIFAGKSAPWSAMGGLFEAAQFASTVGDAVGFITNHTALLADRGSLQVTIDEELAAFEIHHPMDVIDSGMTNHAGLALFYRVLGEIASDGIELARVEVATNCFGGVTAYTEYFGAEVREHSSRSALVFHRSFLEKPTSYASTELFQYAKTYFELIKERHTHLARSDDLARLKSAIYRNAEQGRFDGASAAAIAGFSLRSAQRILGENNLTFTGVITDARREIATDLLSQSQFSVDKVGQVVGYSDVRSFRRAFRRWTGMSPSAFRAQQLAGR